LMRDILERIAPPAIIAASRHLRSRLDARCAAPWFTRRFREVLKSRYRAPRLQRVTGRSSAWYVYKQCRLSYQLHCMAWNTRIAARNGLEIAFPFLDRDLVQFLMSIPGEIQSHEGIPRNLMRQAMRGIVPEAIVNRLTKGVFTHLGNESIESDFDAIKELLGPRCLAVEMGYFESSVLSKTLDEWRAENLRSDTSIVAWRIIELCGVEAFLRSFFGPAAR
jgi:asparagine synthase (glutamine-hydrolysing)